MARNHKSYEDDDGRTIADMSGVGRSGDFSPSPFFSPTPFESSPKEEPENKSESSPISKEERFAWVGGALSAALLIGTVFLLGIGLLILFLTVVWK